MAGDAYEGLVVGGSFVERLVCHGRLPLVAGVEAARPVVHVWEHGSGGLREVGAVGGDAGAYPEESWLRYELVPDLAWHPYEPKLVVTAEQGLRTWTPDGVGSEASAPTEHHYRYVAFSPDGRALWASPAAGGDGYASDVVDLGSGEVGAGPGWDTAVVEHPGGGLAVTLSSDQGATDVLFARTDGGLRLLRDAIVLDVDGYEHLVFSDDGRFLAVRGNAYAQTLDVFEFPSLRRVLHTTLGEPYPGYPYPPEWLEEQARWSYRNTAFAAGSAVLVVGMAEGGLLTIDLGNDRVDEHPLGSAPVSAVASLSTGRLVVADREGRVTVMDPPVTGADEGRAADARTRVEQFLAATEQLPDGADLDEDLIRHDGERAWSAGDLEAVTAAGETDPTWLRLRAAINTHLGRDAN